VTYIDEHKHLFGVEPICQALTSFRWPIASSTAPGTPARDRCHGGGEQPPGASFTLTPLFAVPTPAAAPPTSDLRASID